MRKTSKSPQSIVWAVDPFENSAFSMRSAVRAIRLIVGNQATNVFPIYVWGSTLPEVEVSPREWSYQGIREAAHRRLLSVLKSVAPQGLNPLHVPAQPAIGLRDGTKLVIDYAKAKRAELIVVSTRGGGGLKRLALGSFTETLVLRSDVPVLSVHPDWNAKPIKSVFFATDFSLQSKVAYLQAIEFCKRRSLKIVLFHKVQVPQYPAFDFAYATLSAYSGALEAEIHASRTIARDWAALARTHDVLVEISLDESRLGSPAEAILKRSGRGGFMIALASQSGAISALLVGSTARQIVRKSKQPVWIIHTEAKSGRKKKASRFMSKRNSENRPRLTH